MQMWNIIMKIKFIIAEKCLKDGKILMFYSGIFAAILVCHGGVYYGHPCKLKNVQDNNNNICPTENRQTRKVEKRL